MFLLISQLHSLPTGVAIVYIYSQVTSVVMHCTHIATQCIHVAMLLVQPHSICMFIQCLFTCVMCILLCSYMYTGYSQGLDIYREKYTAHMQTVILFVILDNPVCNTAEFYVFQSYLKYSAILLHICILIPFERYSERVYVCVCVDHTRISSAAVYSPFCIPHQRFCGSDSTWDSR